MQALLRLVDFGKGLDVDRIVIAGSVRRGKPEVKDLELVAIPLFIDDGLFDDRKIKALNRELDLLVDQLVRKGFLDTKEVDLARFLLPKEYGDSNNQ